MAVVALAAQRSGGSSTMGDLIGTVAAGVGNGIGWMAEHWVLFGMFALFWIAFVAALIQGSGGLDQAWTTIRGWPLIVQVGAWLLFLPVMVGLWVWETTWPLVGRLVLIAGIAGWNLLVLMPSAGRVAQP
jgi:hypothetical protein